MPTLATRKSIAGLLDADRTDMVRPQKLPSKPVDRPVMGVTVTATANVRMMHFLERVAASFNAAGVPLMALKGAALNLALYRRPDERSMADLDLLIQPQDIDSAFELLEQLGCRRSQIFMREDFFPRFYYEVEFKAGTIFPVTIDLHVRPLRPVRFLGFLPDDALWNRAVSIGIGNAKVMIPSVENMLIHLTAHSSVHGHSKRRWLKDIELWAQVHQEEIDWELFLQAVAKWRLSLAVLDGIEQAQQLADQVFCPAWVIERLRKMKSNWLDRLAMRQAPRDNSHPVTHVLVNLLCAPNWRFRLSYLWATLVPDSNHMREWYPKQHAFWLPIAHLCRFLGPITAWVAPLATRLSKVRVQKHPDGRIGLFATTDIKTGQAVMHRRHDPLVTPGRIGLDGAAALDRSDRPNVQWFGEKLVAIKPIRAGTPVAIGICES